MVSLHLYGELRRHARQSRANAESVLEVRPRPGATVREVIESAGIDAEGVCHVFLNGSLLSTRNSMAPWLEYQRREGQGLETRVSPGDRLGLFAGDMALLVV